MTKLNKQLMVEQLMLQDIFANATKKAVTEFVEDFFDMIKTNVIAGNEVSIPGFGKFYKYAKTKEGKLTGAFTPKFSAFTDFKDAINA